MSWVKHIRIYAWWPKHILPGYYIFVKEIFLSFFFVWISTEPTAHLSLQASFNPTREPMLHDGKRILASNWICKYKTHFQAKLMNHSVKYVTSWSADKMDLVQDKYSGCFSAVADWWHKTTAYNSINLTPRHLVCLCDPNHLFLREILLYICRSWNKKTHQLLWRN